jgi:prepilin-type processing-associated H-X9-DG protein
MKSTRGSAGGLLCCPYVDEDGLYRQFFLNQPWDSEHNKKLIEKMPRIFAPPLGVKSKPGHTFYRMFDCPDSMFRTKKLADVADGLANTLMIFEAGESEIWTKPDELDYDPKKPLPKLGGHFDNGMNVAFADGMVKFIKKPINEKVFRAWITATGGESIQKDKK